MEILDRSAAEAAGELTGFEAEVRAASIALNDFIREQNDFTRGQDAVLGVLGKAQAETIRTGRTPGELGPFMPPSGFTGTPFADTGVEGIAPAFDPEVFTRKFEAAGEDFAAQQRSASLDFAKNVIDAGNQFISAIGQFQAGNIGGGVAGLAGTAGSLFSSIGSLAGLAGAGPIGALIGAGGGLLGGLINLIGGGGNDHAEAQRAERARVRGAPALQFTVNIRQDYQVTGGFTSPEARQFINQAARSTVDEIFSRTRLLERMQLQEARS